MSKPASRLWDILNRARALADAVIVPVSGKDSLCVLDACCRVFRRIEAFHWYFVPGLSFRDAALARTEKRYGIKVHRLPHFDLSRLLRCAALRVPNAATCSLPTVQQTDVEAEMRRRSGLNWIAYGHKRADSLGRVGMLSACNGIDEKKKRFYPIAYWSQAFVFRYLKQRRIPLSSEYSIFQRNFDGGDLRGKTLVKLRLHYPEDYARVRAVFPFVDGEVLRHELHGEAGRLLPAVSPSRFYRSQQVPEEPAGLGSPESDSIPSVESQTD